MDVSLSSSFGKRPSADLIILPFWQDKKKAPRPATSCGELLACVAAPIDTQDFHGKEGETQVVYCTKQKEKRILLLGLGEEEKCSLETLRRCYALCVKIALRKKWTDLNVCLPQHSKLGKHDIAESAAEGMFLAHYRFDHIAVKEEPDVVLKSLTFVGADKAEFETVLRAQQVVSSVNFARDLVNGNADDITPQKLSEVAQDLGRQYKQLSVAVFDKKRIEKEKMGLLLAVNRGSNLDPAFIILQYKGDPKSKEHTVVVGKGITYDTGGLRLKTSGMETMKCDMAGAATVLGLIRTAAALKLKVNLTGVIASTENSIGPASYKMGDVYVSHAKKSVEITDTDAEGRLVLADALSYVQEKLEPTRIIDLATLTGAITVALGDEVTGLFCNHDPLAHALIEAGLATGETLWRMPLVKDYKEMLKSPIADLKNAAGRKGGSITAALFLEAFIKPGVHWAHLDIAGSAFLPDPKYYHPTHATGVGVRLLLRLLSHV